MFLAIVSLMFFLAVVQGFVRVVMYFWDWLSQGEKLDRHEVSRAEQPTPSRIAPAARASPCRSHPSRCIPCRPSSARSSPCCR